MASIESKAKEKAREICGFCKDIKDPEECFGKHACEACYAVACYDSAIKMYEWTKQEMEKKIIDKVGIALVGMTLKPIDGRYYTHKDFIERVKELMNQDF